MRLIYAGILLIGLVGTVACRKDAFEPDPANEMLPAYTEKGNNVGGALINGLAWRTYMNPKLLDRRRGLVVQVDTDTVRLLFDGNMQKDIANKTPQTLSFMLSRTGRAPFTLDSLLHLHNRRFVLDGRRYIARIDPYGLYPGQYGAGRGELFVRRVQQKGNEYILSGTFHFTVYSRTDSVRVTDGRFDHRISRLDH